MEGQTSYCESREQFPDATTTTFTSQSEQTGPFKNFVDNNTIQDYREVIHDWPDVDIHRLIMSLLDKSMVHEILTRTPQALRATVGQEIQEALIEGRNLLEPRLKTTIVEVKGRKEEVSTRVETDVIIGELVRSTPITRRQTAQILWQLPPRARKSVLRSLQYTAQEKPLTIRDLENASRLFTPASNAARRSIAQDI